MGEVVLTSELHESQAILSFLVNTKTEEIKFIRCIYKKTMSWLTFLGSFRVVVLVLFRSKRLVHFSFQQFRVLDSLITW